MSNGFNPLTQKLKRLAPLSAQDEQTLDGFVQNTKLFSPGDEIAFPGEQGQHLPVVIEGLVSRSRRVSGERRQITAFLLPGDMCDPHCFALNHGRHRLSAVGVSRVAMVATQDIEQAILGDSALGRGLWRSTQREGAIALEWVVMLGRLDAMARTAHLICELQARLEMVGLADSNTFEMPITQRLLADVLGLSVVHVNRTMRRLQNDGLLRMRHAVIEIADAARLRDLAEFDPAYLYWAAGKK